MDVHVFSWSPGPQKGLIAAKQLAMVSWHTTESLQSPAMLQPVLVGFSRPGRQLPLGNPRGPTGVNSLPPESVWGREPAPLRLRLQWEVEAAWVCKFWRLSQGYGSWECSLSGKDLPCCLFVFL